MGIISICILTAAVVFFSVCRLFFGVEFTDEAYYVATVRNEARGALPYLDALSLSSGFPLSVVWIERLYEQITGGTEGLFLFMRLAYFAFKAVICLVVILLLRRHFPTPGLVLTLLALLYFAPSNLSNFSYNSVPALWFLLTSALLFSAVRGAERQRVKLFAAGVAAAFASVANPPLTLVAIFLTILIPIFLRIEKGRALRVGWWLIGAAVVAVPLFAAISRRAGGLLEALARLEVFVPNGSGVIRVATEDQQNMISNVFEPHHDFFVLICIVIAAGFCVRLLLSANRGRVSAQGCEIERTVVNDALCIIAVVYMVMLLHDTLSAVPSNRYLLTYETSIVFIPVALLVWNSRPGCFRDERVMALFWCIPPLATLVIMSILNAFGVSGRWYSFAFIAALVPLFAFRAGVHRVVSYAVSGILIVLTLYSSYAYIYRDSPAASLTTQVGGGVYKGIWTTQERAEGIVALEETLREHIAPEKTILFRDVVPFGYLMVDNPALSQDAWDPLQYSYGLDDGQRLKSVEEYAASHGGYADCIVYVDFGRDEVMSIDDDTFPFTEFVKKNYSLTYEDRDAIYPVVIYEKAQA